MPVLKRHKIVQRYVKMFKFVLLLLAASTVLSTVTLAENSECNGPHEEYQCGSECQTTCANLGERCHITNVRCKEDCYCVEGYARNSNNVCIPIKSCPSKRRTVKYNRRLLPFLAGII